MDNKRLILVMLLTIGLMTAWYFVNVELHRRHPEWYPRPGENVATTQTAPPPAVESASPTTQTAAATSPADFHVESAAPQTAELGSQQFDPQGKQPYAMGLVIASRGAAIESATLNQFRQEVQKDAPYVFQRPYTQGSDALTRALATQAIEIDQHRQDLFNVDWERLPGGTATSVTYATRVLVGGGEGPLTIRKQYELRPSSDASKGYEIKLTYSMENKTGRDLTVRLIYSGPNVPPVENTRDVPEVVVGHFDEHRVQVTHSAGTSFAVDKGAVPLDVKGGPVLWAGVAGAYFNGIVRPPLAASGDKSQIEDISVQALAAPDPVTAQTHVNLTFRTPEMKLEKGQTLSMPLEVYFGPRKRDVLETAYYTAFPLSYQDTLVLTGGACAWCTFPALITFLVWLLRTFHAVLGDWGLAIITLVLIVRLLLHPITKKSQVEMSKMGKMGPEMERLKKKHGDNKEELNKAMMSLYKEQGMTPILGCLPMLLQMPIWFALWSALQSTFELRHASFLWGMTWIHDLAQPDRLLKFAPVSIWFFHLDGLNVLPILMGVVFWIQQKLTPKPAAMTPEQAQQQKMMQYMSLLFPLLFYSGPSGLNLYMLTSTGIGIWESKRVRDHIKAKEEAEKAGRVIVEAKPTRASRRLAREDTGEPKKTGIAGWLAQLQDRAEALRRNSGKKDKDKGDE